MAHNIESPPSRTKIEPRLRGHWDTRHRGSTPSGGGRLICHACVCARAALWVSRLASMSTVGRNSPRASQPTRSEQASHARHILLCSGRLVPTGPRVRAQPVGWVVGVWSWEGLTRSGLGPRGGAYCVSRVAAAYGVSSWTLMLALTLAQALTPILLVLIQN